MQATADKAIIAEKTLMFQEAKESAEAVRRQIAKHSDDFARIGSILRKKTPNVAVMVGRGSSDHAGVYGRYLIEILQGVITSPSGLSVSSLYKAPLHTQNIVSFAISQSGQSPDLVSSVKNIRAHGGYTIALTNTVNSALGAGADATIDLCAGPEESVAATKSFITSMAALVLIIAHWTNDFDLLNAVNTLPDRLEKAWSLDWSAASGAFEQASNAFILGRGVGYGITREAALKFKETSGIHAEAYSAAEVLHGPSAIIEPGFPILAFSQNDETRGSVEATLNKLARMGANIFTAGVDHPDCTSLPTLEAHPLIQPILMIQSFYKLVNGVSVARGFNPDKPPHLSKVTETF